MPNQKNLDAFMFPVQGIIPETQAIGQCLDATATQLMHGMTWLGPIPPTSIDVCLEIPWQKFLEP
jgi:hypothetical protein